MKRRGWAIAVVIFMGIVLSTQRVSPAAAFSVAPTKYVVTVDPGKTRKLTVEVTNDETEPILIKPVVIGAKQLADGRMMFQRGSDVAENWFGDLENVITVAPRAKSMLVYEISVPVDAAPGSHYIGLVVESIPSGVVSGTALRGQVAVITSIQVAGLVHEDVSASAKIDPAVIIGGKKITLSLILENKGNIEVPLWGELEVMPPWTDDSKKIKLSLGNELFAKTRRQLSYQVELPGIKPGFKNASGQEEKAVIPSEKITQFTPLFKWPGKYILRTTLVYGKTGQVAVKMLSMWYLPWWGVGSALIVVGLLIMVCRNLRRFFGSFQAIR